MEKKTEGNITIRQLAQEVVNAAEHKSSPSHFQKFLSQVADVNESILNNIDDKFEFTSPGRLQEAVVFEAVAHQPNLTILHIQLISLLSLTFKNSADNSILPSLKKHMLAVVSSGGDIDLPICGVILIFDESTFVTGGPISPFELVSRAVSDQNLDNDDDLKYTKELQKVIMFMRDLKAANPFKKSRPLSPFMKTLLLSTQLSDVNMLCPDGTTYPAHQTVLSNSSDYFKAYFMGPWSRQQSGEGGGSGEYKTEVDSEILKHILTFMYTGNFGRSLGGMSTSTMCDIFHSGHQFQIIDLVDSCCNVLESRITLDTIKDIVTCAAVVMNSSSPGNNDGSTLWTSCIKFIHENAAYVMLDTDFSTLKDKSPNLWKDLQEEISKPRKRKRDEDTDNDEGDHETDDDSDEGSDAG